jgi:hypothetical protein
MENLLPMAVIPLKHDLASHIIVGPLNEQDLAKIPSPLLMWLENADSSHIVEKEVTKKLGLESSESIKWLAYTPPVNYEGIGLTPEDGLPPDIAEIIPRYRNYLVTKYPVVDPDLVTIMLAQYPIIGTTDPYFRSFRKVEYRGLSIGIHWFKMKEKTKKVHRANDPLKTLKFIPFDTLCCVQDMIRTTLTSIMCRRGMYFRIDSLGQTKEAKAKFIIGGVKTLKQLDRTWKSRLSELWWSDHTRNNLENILKAKERPKLIGKLAKETYTAVQEALKGRLKKNANS